MRILTLCLLFISFGAALSFGQTDSEEGYFLKDLKVVVHTGDEPMTYEKDGMVYLEVKRTKKSDQIEVTHITGEGSYSTRMYYATPEGIVINNQRNALALPDGEWIFFEKNKPVKKQWFRQGELIKEKNL
jgi:hypothetical protein